MVGDEVTFAAANVLVQVLSHTICSIAYNHRTAITMELQSRTKKTYWSVDVRRADRTENKADE